MKKAIFICFFMLIPAISCFAGSFYSNIVVFSENVENIFSIIKQLGITAYYILMDRLFIIFEEKIDEQQVDYGKELSKNISKKTNGAVMYTTNHDSDILLIYMYKNGTEIFSYNSNPFFFEGRESKPSIIGINNFINEFTGVNKETLVEILTTQEVFSEDIHSKIIELLKLPDFCYYGYQTIIEDDESMSELEQKYNIKIKEITGK